MKKCILSLASLLALGTLNAQVRIVNSASNTSATNSPAFIDASSNTTLNGSSNVGKGLIFPRVDLSAMTAFPNVTAGIPNSFPTRFDGMIVYNTAASGTAGVGATSGTLTPGYWYYENKSSTNNGGTWKSLGSIAAAAIEPWYNATTNTAATANTQDVYQMGKVGIGTATPTSTLHTNGSFATRYIAVSADTSLDITHHSVNAVHNSGTVTLTLPPVSGITGRQYVVQNNGYGTTNVVVSGGGTIEGLTTFTMNQVGQTAQLIAGNSEWQLVTNAIKSTSVPSGANIYTADGMLSGNRIVNMGSNTLTFTGGIITGNISTMQTVIPNGSASLGNSSSRWVGFYGQNGDLSGGIRTSGLSTMQTILPNGSASFGNSSLRWAGIYAQNTDLSGGLITGGISTMQTILPNGSASFGNSSLRWAGIYAQNTDLSGGLITGGISTMQTILPNGSASFGNSSLRWAGIYAQNTDLSGGLITGGISTMQTIVPNGSASLGNSSSRWIDIYAQNGNFSTGIATFGVSVMQSITPAASGASLGNQTDRWNSLYAQSGNFSGGIATFGVSVMQSITPAASGASLGNQTDRWNNLYAQNGNLSGGLITNGVSYMQTILPASDNGASLGNPSSRWNSVFAVNGTIQTSDARLKKDIHNIGYGINTIMRMRPVEYNWKDGKGKHMVGFIAQEMEKVVPEAVEVPKKPEEYYGMKYEQLIPVLTKAIQEQQAEIEQLKAIVKGLQSKAK